MEELIRVRWPTILDKWDKWNYRIYGPSGFEDHPVVTVRLENQNKEHFILEIPLVGSV